MAVVDRRGVSLSMTDSPVAGVPSADLAIKTACICATVSNITLAGVQTIDGVPVGNNAERVLVLNQSDPTLNGIYNASSGNWTRATDADGNTELANGQQVLVIGGVVNGGYKGFVCTSADPITIGTSQIIFQALAFPNSSIEFIIDGGGGTPIQPGYKGAVEVPFGCRIVRSRLLGDVAGNFSIDIRKSTLASFPPSPTNSIVASDPPKLVAAQTAEDTALTGWTTPLLKGDVLSFYVVSNDILSIVTASLLVVRN